MKRRVLVTGSSRGIGRAIALDLSAAGFEVVLHGRSDSTALRESQTLLESAGAPARAVFFDGADRDACKRTLEDEIGSRGAFWGVVCNAGLCADAPFPALTGDDWDRVLRTNLDGFYNVLQPLVMPMIQLRAGGRIVTLSSIAGIAGNRGQVNYSASKAGIIGASKALAQELGRSSRSVRSPSTASLPV
jgi:3-oxoacyl-[acyl-carrier protein] reductase